MSYVLLACICCTSTDQLKNISLAVYSDSGHHPLWTLWRGAAAGVPGAAEGQEQGLRDDLHWTECLCQGRPWNVPFCTSIVHLKMWYSKLYYSQQYPKVQSYAFYAFYALYSIFLI